MRIRQFLQIEVQNWKKESYMNFSVAMTMSNIMDAQLQEGWEKGCHPPVKFYQTTVYRCDPALSILVMFDVWKPSQAIGILRYTTAGCYYGYFGREGLG